MMAVSSIGPKDTSCRKVGGAAGFDMAAVGPFALATRRGAWLIQHEQTTNLGGSHESHSI